MYNKKYLIYLFMIAIICGCSTPRSRYLETLKNEPNDWAEAKRIDTIPAYEHFITIHKSGERVKKAKQIIQRKKLEAGWEVAQKTNSIKSYEEYIDKFDLKDGEYYKKAKHAITELNWTKAKEEKSFAGYYDFINDFKNSSHIQEAQKWMDAFLASKKDLGKQELDTIKKEVASVLKPFELSNLVDKLSTTPQNTTNGTEMDVQTKSEKDTVTMVYRFPQFSSIRRSKIKKEGGHQLKVTLIAQPEDKIIVIFNTTNPEPPSLSNLVLGTDKEQKTTRHIRIFSPNLTKSNVFTFSRIEIFKDYNTQGKPAEFFCNKNKCYDFNYLKLEKTG